MFVDLFNSPSVTATTVVHVNLPESHHNPQQANATPIANSSSNAGGGVGSVSNWTADDVAIFAQQPSPSTATFFPPNAATSTSVLKKNKKDKTRRTSNIFGIGASKSKKVHIYNFEFCLLIFLVPFKQNFPLVNIVNFLNSQSLNFIHL